MTRATLAVLVALAIDMVFVGYIFERLFANETLLPISAERIFR